MAVGASILLCASTAYPWGFAAHAYLAHWLNKQEGDRDLNEIYGAMAPDMFNFRFDLPVYGDGEIYQQLHYLWQNVWDRKKTGMEKGLGYGFISHNDAWGADFTAHHAGITHGTEEGYVIAKAEELLAADPTLLLLTDEQTALELCHTFVEYGLEILTTRIDPTIGQQITAAAVYRSPRFSSMLVEAYAESFAPLFGNDPAVAQQVIVAGEAEFRGQMMLYGQLLMLDEETLTLVFAQHLAEFADEYGVEVPPWIDPVEVIQSYLQTAVQICEDGYAAELHATAQYLDAAMAFYGVGNSQ